MNKPSLAEAIARMQVHLSEKLVDFTSAKVREMSEEIKQELDTEYNYFFQFIIDEVIFAVTTPPHLVQYTSWEPLSDKWSHEKATSRFYVGLSNSRTTGNALGRDNASGFARNASHAHAPHGRIKVGSFQSYIESLNRAGTTARFFGPVMVSYDFMAPSGNFKVSPKVEGSVIKRTDVREKGRFVAFPKTLQMEAKIEAFTNLKGIPFNEWAIVDYIIKQIDPTNEKQWVKINSQYGIGRSRRPIRAVVTPILKYFIEQRFPEIVEEAVKARR